MGLFDDKTHIKRREDLHKELRKAKWLSSGERKNIEDKAKRFMYEPSGMSKKEWEKRVIEPLHKDKESSIGYKETNRLKKLG